MAILEGRWDCDACGRKGIRGGERVCPGCARPRPQNVKFYLPHDAPVVTDAAALHEAKAGPDWYCEHCGAGNSALRTACKQCGAAKGSSPSHKVTDYSLDDVPHSADESPPLTPSSTSFAELRVSALLAAAKPSPWQKLGVPAAVVGGLLLIGLLLTLLLRSP